MRLKKNLYSRIISGVIAASMVLSSIQAAVFADSDVPETEPDVTIDYTVSETEEIVETEVVIETSEPVEETDDNVATVPEDEEVSDEEFAEDDVEPPIEETEALAAGSEFSYCFSTTAGSFNDILRSGAKSFVGQSQRNNFLNFIENRSKYLFRYPFPDYELLVFEIPNATKKPELVFTNSKDLVSKRALCLSFEYLVRVNGNDASYSDEMRRKGADIAKNVFGGETDPEIMAETQRGKTTFSFYKLTSGWFLWDCFKIDNGDVYGFYLVAKNDRTTETAGKLLALRELRDNQSKAEHKNYGAFIPLFPGYDGVIANEEVYNSYTQKIKRKC